MNQIPYNLALFVGENQYSTNDFYTLVANYRAQIRETLCEPSNARVLLFDADVFQFLVRLFALSSEGATVVLPPNDQSGTILDLLDGVDYLAGSLHTGDKPSIENSASHQDCTESFVWPQLGKLVFFTSGSSGKAKKIVKDWQLLNNELEVLSQVFPVVEPNVFLATVSHQHIYGLLFRALLPLLHGKTLYNTFEYPEHLVDVLANTDKAVLISSPAFLSRLVKDNVLSSYSEKIRLVFSSGGKLDEANANCFFQQMQQAVIEVYGSTETGGIAYRFAEPSSNSLWQLFPNISCAIESTSNQIILRSPFINQESMLLDDIGRIKDGQLQLLGRKDRTVKLEEKRVNLSQMEVICRQHPWVEDVKLLTLNKERLQIAAVVKLNDEGLEQVQEQGKRAISQILKGQLLTHFELVTLPRKWRFLPEFPYNVQGKLPVVELEKLFV